jgi:Zn-dependent M32 family carboxypeptidase
MPSGGASARSMQKSALAGVIYEKRTAPAPGELLQQLHDVTDSSSFSKEQLAVIRDAVRDYALETRKSKDMASKESELEGKAYHAWYVYTIYTVDSLCCVYEVVHICMHVDTVVCTLLFCRLEVFIPV